MSPKIPFLFNKAPLVDRPVIMNSGKNGLLKFTGKDKLFWRAAVMLYLGIQIGGLGVLDIFHQLGLI